MALSETVDEERRGTVASALLLFHVHFDVADVPAAEAEFERQGFHVRARFGYLGREHTRFGPEVSWEELDERGVRLRLVELERGAVNVVLMRAKVSKRRLGQVGFSADADEHERVLVRARDLGLKTRPNEVRSFVRIDRGLDLELSDARRYAYGDDALAELRIESLVIATPEPESASRLVRELVGPQLAGQLAFVQSREAFARLDSWSLVTAAA